jgi:hypothetical protein
MHMAKNLFRFLCVVLAMSAARIHAAGPDENFINQRSFSIPITIAGDRQDKIKEVELYVSTDDGKTWNGQAVIGPDRGEFVYTAPADGAYWFKVCILDKDGNREPKDIYKSGKVNKIFVDTLPPTLRIVKAERQGDNVLVMWEAQELNPDFNSYKLEYKLPDGVWYPTTITPTLVGQQAFRSPHNGPLKVRLLVSDLAGNQTPAEADVLGRADEIGSNLTTTSMQVPPAGQSGGAAPTPVFPPMSPPAASITSQSGFTPPLVQNNTATPLNNQQPVIPSGYAPVVPSITNNANNSQPGLGTSGIQHGAGGGSSLASNPLGSGQGAGTTITYPTANNSPRTNVNSSLEPAPESLRMRGNSGAMPANWQTNPQAQGGTGYAADNRGANEQAWSAPAARSRGGIGLPQGNPQGYVATRWINNVQTTVTNSTQISLDYEVDRKGPSGVGLVELYLTQDEGRTWTKYHEVSDPTGAMVVDLPGEGLFGLKLRVRNKAGLGHRPPQNGDAPEMRVEVDMTPPVVKLYRPEPDPHRRDAVLLTWQASDDRCLATNPITLQWAERPDGPWTNIATNLTNTGRHVWHVEPKLMNVYLRVVARDVAGNLGFDESPEPQLVDLTEPDARILRISSGIKHP